MIAVIGIRDISFHAGERTKSAAVSRSASLGGRGQRLGQRDPSSESDILVCNFED